MANNIKLLFVPNGKRVAKGEQRKSGDVFRRFCSYVVIVVVEVELGAKLLTFNVIGALTGTVDA